MRTAFISHLEFYPNLIPILSKVSRPSVTFNSCLEFFLIYGIISHTIPISIWALRSSHPVPLKALKEEDR